MGGEVYEVNFLFFIFYEAFTAQIKNSLNSLNSSLSPSLGKDMKASCHPTKRRVVYRQKRKSAGVPGCLHSVFFSYLLIF
jgi:hypothetical protein